MSDNDQEPGPIHVPPPPRRRKAPSTKHVPPPPRRARPQTVAGASNGADALIEQNRLLQEQNRLLQEQNQEFGRRFEQVKSGGIRYVEREVEPKPEFVLSEGMSDFTRGLVERTHDVPDNYGGDREPPYNIPMRLYLKPSPKNRPNDLPTYVWLQGDARSRAYYADKGYYLLTPEQTQQYVKTERPRMLQEERAKAALINAMRLLVKREATLSGYVDDAEWDDSLSSMTTDRLEEEWHTLCRQTANPDRRLPKAERVREERDVEGARLLAGVDTAPPRADSGVLDALEQQAEGARRRRSRDIEVTPQNANSFR